MNVQDEELMSTTHVSTDVRSAEIVSGDKKFLFLIDPNIT